jgi:Ca-activated chloride channel family protein
VALVADDKEGRWKLEELADRAGVSPRTVRYYVQRGLLPAPRFQGRDTVYSAEHLARLKAIRRLQERFLPLDRIQAELEGRSLDELRRLAETRGAAPRAASPPAEGAPVARAQQWARFELAPGLELHVGEGASEAVRALADELKAHARRRGQGGP